ncbi:MAG: hypothetical protein R2695_03170 [Acidimicrobiales bacterium]
MQLARPLQEIGAVLADLRRRTLLLGLAAIMRRRGGRLVPRRSHRPSHPGVDGGDRTCGRDR